MNYYFAATILRNDRKILRTGTLNAVNEHAALEAVYEMGRCTWGKEVVEVTLMDPATGVASMTSKREDWGKSVIKHKPPVKEVSKFTPMNKPILRTFQPIDIGEIYTPETFVRLKLK